jgi:integrase
VDIPAEFSKNGLSHRVPLNPQAVSLLKDLQTWQEKRLAEVNDGRAKKHLEAKKPSEWAFPSRWYEGESLAWTRKATKRIREASGVDFRPHDLRRTAASLMTGTGTSRVVVSKILNHVETGVTAVYDRHSYDPEKRIALDAWGRQVEAILTEKPASAVLQFNRA